MPSETINSAILDALEDLSPEDFNKFRQALRDRREEPRVRRNRVDGKGYLDITDVLISTFTEEGALEVAAELLRRIGCNEEADRLAKLKRRSSSKPGSSDDEHFVDKYRHELIKRVTNIEPILNELLLRDIINQHTYDQIRALPTSSSRTRELCNVCRKTGTRSKDVFYEVLQKHEKHLIADLQPYQNIWGKGAGPSTSMELKGCSSTEQESGVWTKLEAEVNSTDADEAPTYSLHSEAGNFECSVSGLRWSCKEKVSLKFQFCSGKEPMERIERLKYMPAGPLMDITVISGKLDEMYLPHWICIDDDPSILTKFAVLHVGDCGDSVEIVSEVTSSHVKLSDPHFSLKMVLVRAGVGVRINCKVLIYKTNTAFLTLHVYLIPNDTGIQQAMDRRELSHGYTIIRKPHPEKSLRMNDCFILTADSTGARISPDTLMLRYEGTDPNFFEVYIKNPATEFTLKLKAEKELEALWIREIREEEYQDSGQVKDEHFVARHQCELTARVSNIGPILDNLLREGVIQGEDYNIIRVMPTTQEKMRTLYSGPLRAAGQAGKDSFYRILRECEPFLVDDLNR